MENRGKRSYSERMGNYLKRFHNTVSDRSLDILITGVWAANGYFFGELTSSNPHGAVAGTAFGAFLPYMVEKFKFRLYLSSSLVFGIAGALITRTPQGMINGFTIGSAFSGTLSYVYDAFKNPTITKEAVREEEF